MATLYEYYNAGDDGTFLIQGGSYWSGETFTVVAGYKITSHKVKAYRVGTPGNAYIKIRATSGGVPTGGDLTSGSTSADGWTDASPGDWYEISVTSLLLAPGVYAVILRCDGTGGNGLYWRKDGSSPTYAGGSYVESSNGGVDWTAYTAHDCMFENWGVPAYVPKPSGMAVGGMLIF